MDELLFHSYYKANDLNFCWYREEKYHGKDLKKNNCLIIVQRHPPGLSTRTTPKQHKFLGRKLQTPKVTFMTCGSCVTCGCPDVDMMLKNQAIGQ